MERAEALASLVSTARSYVIRSFKDMTMKLIRFLRGVLGTAAAWSVACVPLTLAVWGVVAAFGGVFPPSRYLAPMLVGAAVRGAISGAVFAVVLAIAGRRRSFATLRFRDMVLWGAIGGVLVPTVGFGIHALTTSVSASPLALGVGFGITAAVGAVTAAGTLWIARKAPELGPSEPELLLADVDPA